MKTSILISLLAVAVCAGCGGSGATTAVNSMPRNTNANSPANAANTEVANFAIETGPLIGKWRGTDYNQKDAEVEYLPTGKYIWYWKGKADTPVPYKYLSATKAETLDPKTGQPFRTFEFTRKGDDLTIAWDQGALPLHFVREK